MSYLAFIRCRKCWMTGISVMISAEPSSTTGFLGSSVDIETSVPALMLRILREPRLEENQRTPSSHTPHTGMVCGRPSGQTVATQ